MLRWRRDGAITTEDFSTEHKPDRLLVTTDDALAMPTQIGAA